jgi:hypothetical protein
VVENRAQNPGEEVADADQLTRRERHIHSRGSSVKNKTAVRLRLTYDTRSLPPVRLLVYRGMKNPSASLPRPNQRGRVIEGQRHSTSHSLPPGLKSDNFGQGFAWQHGTRKDAQTGCCPGIKTLLRPTWPSAMTPVAPP